MASSRQAGTPRPIVDKLNAALRAALGDPKVHGHIATEGAEPLPTSPDRICGPTSTARETKWSALGEEVRRVSEIKTV